MRKTNYFLALLCSTCISLHTFTTEHTERSIAQATTDRSHSTPLEQLPDTQRQQINERQKYRMRQVALGTIWTFLSGASGIISISSSTDNADLFLPKLLCASAIAGCSFTVYQAKQMRSDC